MRLSKGTWTCIGLLMTYMVQVLNEVELGLGVLMFKALGLCL